MSQLKVAVISTKWPPLWGGSAIYPHRLVKALCKQGIAATGVTLIPEVEGLNNGTAPVVRLPIPETANMDLEKILAAIWDGLLQGNRNALLDEWLDCVCDYLDEEKVDVLILQNQNLVVEEYPRLQELIGQRKVVILAYDIDAAIIERLLQLSTQKLKGTALLESLSTDLREWIKHYESAPIYSLLSTHSIEEEDARLHLTTFSQSLINRAFGSGNSFVLHPPLDDSWWENRPLPRPRIGPLRVGFINPFQIKKGWHIIREMIAHHPEYEFIGLHGGHQTSPNGEDKEGLLTYLNRVGIPHSNLTMKYYMKNVQEFYDSIDVFLFPTLFEGYGMVASEALCRGIPVLTHDIPTVREATMGGAQYIPTDSYADMEEWSLMLTLIERDYQKYATKALAAASRLKERQESESRDLIGFIESLK